MTAPDLAVGEHGAAEAFAEEHVDEVADPGRAAVACSARAAQLTSLSTVTGPSTRLGQHGGRVERAEQEGRVRELDEPPALPVHGIGGADDGEPERPGPSATSPATRFSVRATCPAPGERVTGASDRATTSP